MRAARSRCRSGGVEVVLERAVECAGNVTGREFVRLADVDDGGRADAQHRIEFLHGQLGMASSTSGAIITAGDSWGWTPSCHLFCPKNVISISRVM